VGSRQNAWFWPVKYRSMPTAALSPAATASTTDEGPVTASPPENIHFSEVWPVDGIDVDERLVARLQLYAVGNLLQVESLADGHQHVVGGNNEGIAAFFRTAAAGTIEFAESHGHALDARHALALGDYFDRRGEQFEYDALVFGFLISSS